MRTVVLSLGGLSVAKRPAQPGFKIDFEISGTRDRQTDWHQARVWNMKRESENLIKPGVFVQVQAGFRTNVGVVGTGFVERTSAERMETERVFSVRFTGRNPTQAPLPAVIRSSGTRTEVPVREVFQSYASEYGRAIHGLTLIPADITFPGRYLPDPQTPDQGMAQALDRVRVKTLGEIDLDFVVEGTRILVLDKLPRLAAKQVAVSEGTGLIGSPRPIELGEGVEGISLDIVLDPRIGLDTHIQLRSQYAQSGLYAIQSYTHRGDSYDGLFRTSITGVWIGPG